MGVNHVVVSISLENNVSLVTDSMKTSEEVLGVLRGTRKKIENKYYYWEETAALFLSPFA